MICYVLFISSLLILFYYYKYPLKKKIENFKLNEKEKCKKDTNNTLSDGTKTYFSNEMIDTIVDKNKQFEKVIDTNDETNGNLDILNKSVISSTKKYNQHKDLYTRYNNDLEGIFNELDRNLDKNKGLIDGRKMGVDAKFSEITNKVNSLVGSVKSSGIQNKLTPIITNQIDKALVEKSTKAAEDYNVGAKMSNRIDTTYSKIYEWQLMDNINDTGVFRINAETGEVECLSYDGKNCVRDYKSKYGNDMTNIKSDEVKSLQCGADLKRQFGGTGYEDTNHWCSKAYRQFAKMGSDNIDFNSCPKDWSLIEPKTKTCIAPFDYKIPKDIVPEIFEGSELLTKEQKETLRGWLPAKTNTKLLYRGSRDGMNAGAFHSKVDGNGANITILKNNKGQLIGGYTSVDWGSSGSEQVDSSAFLFSLDQNQKYTPLYPQHSSIANVKHYGPTFGSGHDLMIFGWSSEYGDCYHNANSFNYNGSKFLTNIHGNGSEVYIGMFKVISIETWQILSSSFSNSQIIGSNGSWQNSLDQWLGNKNKEAELLFRGSRDGFIAAPFHKLCDNKGPTITLVRDHQGHCFGGYTAVSWSQNANYYNDNTAFLFSFNRNKKIMIKNSTYATYNYSGHGPTFGGHDMALLHNTDNPDWNGGNNSYVNSVYYIDNDNLNIIGSGGNTGWFKPQEIEVWAYKEKTKAIALNDDRCKSRECVSLSVLQNNEQRLRWSSDYNAIFPFKLNIGGITEKNANVSKKATIEIDLRIGNTDKPSNASLENFKLYKNGIVINTFRAGNNFTKGASYNQQMLGSNINFNWGSGIIMGLPGIKDNVYIEFIGYIKVPAKKVLFRLGSDDASRLYISTDGNEKKLVKVIDNWRSQSYNRVESDVFQVSQNAYIPFKIEYIEGEADARLTLEWALDEDAVRGTNKYEIISKRDYYYDKNTCSESIKPISNW